MKAIQVTFDERLLARLDADRETKRVGRSEVLRRAAAAYLATRRREAITESYRRGYGNGVEELDGWSDEGTWPEK